MNRILHVFNVHKPSARVYEALATQRGLAGWWTTDVTADVRVGGIIDFRFAEEFRAEMKIRTLEATKKVVWECVGAADEWIGGTFTFELRSRGGSTQVWFTQTYAKAIGDEAYGIFNYNWGYYLQSLKELCEEGKGFPFTG